MRKNFLAAALIPLWAVFGAHAQSETNLLLNGDFEIEKTVPWEWFVGGSANATGEKDSSEKHGGEGSFCIRNESAGEPNVFGAFRQVIKNAKPGTTYAITAWVKGNDVSSGSIACGEKWDKRTQLPRGTYDWTEVRMEYTTGANETEFPMLFIVEGPVGGLWIDDVTLTEIDAEKSAAVFFAPSTWEGIPAALRFYPVPATNPGAGGLPRVAIRSEDSQLGADVSMSGGDFFFCCWTLLIRMRA